MNIKEGVAVDYKNKMAGTRVNMDVDQQAGAEEITGAERWSAANEPVILLYLVDKRVSAGVWSGGVQ